VWLVAVMVELRMEMEQTEHLTQAAVAAVLDKQIQL
jgi:hypothetical protein